MASKSDEIATNFLFGNVDESGKLEGSFFDEESKEMLCNLGSVLRSASDDTSSDEKGLFEIDGDNNSDDDDESNKSEQNSDSLSSAANGSLVAEDFSDIVEAAPDECPMSEGEENESDYEYDQFDTILDTNDNFHQLGQHDDAPLSAMLPDNLRVVDPRKFFPEFRKKETLRFSRLFGPGRKNSRPQIWRGAKSSRKKLTRTESIISQRDGTSASNEFKVDVEHAPTADQCQTDDELRLIRPEDRSQLDKPSTSSNKCATISSNVAPWRYGPAQYWYDKMGVSETGQGFDYGIKLDPDAPITTEKILSQQSQFPADAFLPFNLVHWEDDIIYDGEDVRQSVIDKLSSGKIPICGWIATQHTRTYESFIVTLKNGGFAQMLSRSSQPAPPPRSNVNPDEIVKEPGPNHSIFPLDNQELIHTRWEDDIIWDSEAMDHIPEPKILTLDLCDDPKLYGLPEDKSLDDSTDGGTQDGGSPSKHYDRKEHQFTKKSQLILGLVQRRRKQEEEELESSMANMSDKDPFNLSNDEYYLAKGTSRQISSLGGSLIQHSMPAQNIMRPFFPTSWNAFRLRHFHRHPLKRLARGPLSKHTYHPVNSLERYIKQKKEEREKQRQEQGGGEIFFMREPEDLSAKDGDIICCEYSEEHPPLFQQSGMTSKIKNYYKRKPGKDTEPTLKYGEPAFTHTSPFLGVLAPGQSLQALENNLFRAPIFEQKASPTDFLIIRTRLGYFLRSLPSTFSVGQLCPLMEVPSPNSKRATNFVRDFLLAFIYRLFWSSTYQPRRLRMEDIRKAFPHYAESSVRKRLKQCSDFKRLGQGNDQNFWVLRDDFRLPSREEVQAMITPEMCCAQYSMLAAEQRLKDAGYGEKYFFAPDEDDESDQVTMEDEIRCAPWNTTRAYISAVKGKCLLDQTGIADPTGCGEGFSYIRVSTRPPKHSQEEQPPVPKRLVTGTDADLRKLPLKDAKQMLRDFSVKEEEINSLTRWEIIDVIRTLSTQQAKSKSDFTGIARFARGNIRFSLAEMQEKYKQESQRVFNLQNKVLSSAEILSSDEESSGDDSDMEEMGKNIESMLSGKRNDRKAMMDAEEKERLELQKIMRGEIPGKTDVSKTKKKNEKENEEEEKGGRKLKINRTFKTDDGTEYEISEIVTRPQLIDAYLKIRTTRDEAFIKHFAQMDEEYKEEKRKEKRRLQDQLRRIRRNEMKAKQGLPIGRPPPKPKSASPQKPPPPIKPHLMKMKCSACGGHGHMKTNKHCPLYGKAVKQPPCQVALTDEQIDQEFEVPSGQLISVEGTKVKMSRALVEQTMKMKRNALKLKFPKHLIQKSPVVNVLSKGQSGKLLLKRSLIQKKKQETSEEYLKGPKQSVQRRRADPKVTFSVQLDEIVNELRTLAGSAQFLAPVNKKLVPDYHKIIKRPMDLQIIKMSIGKNSYETRESFLADVRQILDNSRLYNGDASDITKAARELFELASLRIAEKEQKLMRLEKAINPLLDDNDVVAFSFILANVTQQCKNLPKSYAFHQPVDPKKVKTYYDKVKNPMDLGTIERKLKKHKYTNLETYLNDVEQVYKNSEAFNGAMSVYTFKAREIWELAKKLTSQQDVQLKEYERHIQKALEAAELESLMTSSVADDLAERRMDSPPLEGDADETIPYKGSDDVFDWNEIEEGQILDDDLHLSGDEDDSDKQSGPLDFSDLREELGQSETGQADLDMSRESEESLDMHEPEGSSLGGDFDTYDPVSELLASSMHKTGQLNADLALSDSDEDMESNDIKHTTIDDFDMTDL